MSFERISATNDAVVEVDQTAKLFRVTSQQSQAAIFFNTGAHLTGKAEQIGGGRDLALRSAIQEAENFFYERYSLYRDALESDPKLAELLNSIADSTNPDEAIARTKAAGEYVASMRVSQADADQVRDAVHDVVGDMELKASKIRRMKALFN